MRTALRRHRNFVLGVMIGALLAGTARALAKVTYDATNAMKVDGFDAIGSSATVTQRKGKLVATNTTTGQLPNNIIADAADSSRIDVCSHAALRTLSLDPHGAYLVGSTGMGPDGATPGEGQANLYVSFV